MAGSKPVSLGTLHCHNYDMSCPTSHRTRRGEYRAGQILGQARPAAEPAGCRVNLDHPGRARDPHDGHAGRLARVRSIYARRYRAGARARVGGARPAASNGRRAGVLPGREPQHFSDGRRPGFFGVGFRRAGVRCRAGAGPEPVRHPTIRAGPSWFGFGRALGFRRFRRDGCRAARGWRRRRGSLPARSALVAARSRRRDYGHRRQGRGIARWHESHHADLALLPCVGGNNRTRSWRRARGYRAPRLRGPGRSE